MTELAHALSDWESFYVIIGSSGGALIGLQFVVITLLADRRDETTPAGLSAFGTPTVVHLTGALVVSAILSAPWPSVSSLSIAVGSLAAAGLVYCAIVIGRARRQTSYAPVWQDWLWYDILPCVSYAALGSSAALLGRTLAVALFVTAAAALALLLIGIHNAWDTVTHIALTRTKS